MDLKEKLQAAINAVLFGENTVEEFAAPVVDTPIVEDTKPVDETVVEDKPLTKEHITKMIEDAIMAASEEIMKEVENKMAELMGQTQDLATQVEAFSKQTISVPVTESVDNTTLLTSKNSKYDSMRFNK